MPYSKKQQNQPIIDSCDFVCKQEPIRQQLKKKPLQQQQQQQQQPLLTIPSTSAFLFARNPATTTTASTTTTTTAKHNKTMTQSLLSNSIVDKMNQKTSSNASSANNNNNNNNHDNSKDCDTSDTSDSDEVSEPFNVLLMCRMNIVRLISSFRHRTHHRTAAVQVVMTLPRKRLHRSPNLVFYGESN